MKTGPVVSTNNMFIVCTELNVFSQQMCSLNIPVPYGPYYWCDILMSYVESFHHVHVHAYCINYPVCLNEHCLAHPTIPHEECAYISIT